MKVESGILVRMGSPAHLFKVGAVCGLILGIAPGAVYSAFLLIMILGGILGGDSMLSLMDGYLGRSLGFLATYFTRGIPVIAASCLFGGAIALVNKESVLRRMLFKLELADMDWVVGLDFPFAVGGLAVFMIVFTDLSKILLTYAAVWGSILYWALWQMMYWPLLASMSEDDRPTMTAYCIGEMLEGNNALCRSSISVRMDGDLVRLSGTVPDRSLISAAKSAAMKVRGVMDVDTEGLTVGEHGKRNR